MKIVIILSFLTQFIPLAHSSSKQIALSDFNGIYKQISGTCAYDYVAYKSEGNTLHNYMLYLDENNKLTVAAHQSISLGSDIHYPNEENAAAKQVWEADIKGNALVYKYRSYDIKCKNFFKRSDRWYGYTTSYTLQGDQVTYKDSYTCNKTLASVCVYKKIANRTLPVNHEMHN